jgi:hypothetical protein
MKTQTLFTRLATSYLALMFLVCISYSHFLGGQQQVMADTSYDARSTFQTNHVRYDGGWSNGIQTYWEADAFPADISDMSYGRVILNVETSGTYTLKVWYATGNAYPVKVFVNGTELDYELPSTGWSNTLGNIPNIELNQGHNVFIIAMLKWGVINGLVTPNGVTVVNEDTSGGVYQAVYGELLVTKLLVSSQTIHDYDAVIYTRPLVYNSNSEYASKVKFTVAASETTKSLNLTYYCSNNTDGIANLNVSINGQAGFDIDFYETANNVLGIKTIATSVLTSNGFLAGQSNTIEIIKPYDNNDSIGLVSLTLSDVEMTLYSTTRNEAEYALLNGGSVEISASGKWSNDGYVGDMGTKTTLTSSSQINEDLSNVNSISFTYEAANSGVYYAYIRYATGLSSIAYMRSDVGQWEEVNLATTTYWDTCRVTVVELNLNAGERSITLTGTTNAGGWVNYDFIDIMQKGTLSDEEIAFNYAVFFREKTSAGCTAKNVNLIPWSQLKSEYLAISSYAKDVFVTNGDETIADARARYQVLINAYPTLASDNWLVDGQNDVVYDVLNNFYYGHHVSHGMIIMSIVVMVTIGLTIVYRGASKKAISIRL